MPHIVIEYYYNCNFVIIDFHQDLQPTADGKIDDKYKKEDKKEKSPKKVETKGETTKS